MPLDFDADISIEHMIPNGESPEGTPMFGVICLSGADLPIRLQYRSPDSAIFKRLSEVLLDLALSLEQNPLNQALTGTHLNDLNFPDEVEATASEAPAQPGESE